jgi:hypothetical protein
LKDPYFFPFSSKAFFNVHLVNGTDDSLSPLLHPGHICHHTCADSRIALVQTRSYVNIFGVTPGEGDFMSVGARL